MAIDLTQTIAMLKILDLIKILKNNPGAIFLIIVVLILLPIGVYYVNEYGMKNASEDITSSLPTSPKKPIEPTPEEEFSKTMISRTPTDINVILSNGDNIAPFLSDLVKNQEKFIENQRQFNSNQKEFTKQIKEINQTLENQATELVWAILCRNLSDSFPEDLHTECKSKIEGFKEDASKKEDSKEETRS